MTKSHREKYIKYRDNYEHGNQNKLDKMIIKEEVVTHTGWNDKQDPYNEFQLQAGFVGD